MGFFTKRRVLTGSGVIVAFGLGVVIGTSGSHTTIKTVAGPTITKTVNVPGPATTKTVIKKVPVPGPTQYKTLYKPASQGPTGTTIASYSGHGNETTGSFSIPSSGDYIVKWSYSGNTDPSMGGGTNFSITDTNTNGMQGDTPNDVATSGSGSTEDTGMSGAQSFNVQATGDWSVQVISAA